MKSVYYRKPELLSPAGDMEKLTMAVAYGADAVYLAGQSYGLRGGPSNFTREEMEKAIQYAHEHGVKVHVTVNIMPRNPQVKALPEYLEFLDGIGADALILADLGSFMLAGSHAPHCERHISTQVSVANYETAKAWYDLGAKRVVLARELSLEEIAYIRSHTPEELEIETFAHGAMCVSYSGRCLLSNYMTGRDGNGGECAQPCRYPYTLTTEKKPGESYPVYEDEQGTYILNSRDMCMISHLEDLMNAGVDCIKVEGRNKSAYYAGMISGAYRHVLDELDMGAKPSEVWLDEVNKVAHRFYSTGFYYGYPGQHYDKQRFIRNWQVSAVVTDCDENGLATLTLKNKLVPGQVVELVRPDARPVEMTIEQLYDMEGGLLTEAKVPQMHFQVKLPGKVPAFSLLRRCTETLPDHP